MRLDGWEARLWAVLEESRAKPYELGVHDCFRVTCRVIEALTGRDRWPEFAGQYTTKREALRLIARYGTNFEAAFDWFFGDVGVPARFARRGDIVALCTDDGEKHLGVCLGLDSAFLAPEGLVHLRTRACVCCWRID